MNMISELFKLKPGTDETMRVNDDLMEGGRRFGENENPYLSARRTSFTRIVSSVPGFNLNSSLIIFMPSLHIQTTLIP